VAAFTVLTPVSGTALSVLLLKESLYAYHFLGIVLAGVGGFIASKESGRTNRSMKCIGSDRSAAPPVVVTGAQTTSASRRSGES
jgi:hypothetical protein